MSDFPNGRPPGQNNIDATTEPYVSPENDPSAMAQKPDSERPKEDGIEAREPPPKEVQDELTQASRNMVAPGSVEDNQQQSQEQGPTAVEEPDLPDGARTPERNNAGNDRKEEAGQSGGESKTPARQAARRS